ncbi:mandelate racemase/muconate lactonizing enzyme family protein [Paraburkholderia graminis]
MRIRSIEVIRAALPFDAGRRQAPQASQPSANTPDAGDAYNAASRTLHKMETLLVKHVADDGSIGWGEAFGHLCNPVTFAALAGPVGRFFIGTEVSADPARFTGRVEAAHQAFHAFGRTGPMLYALSAIDIALWDLCAQAANRPLHRLLGAKRDSVDVYASLVCYDNDPDEVAFQVQRTHRAGFRAMKLHETQRAAIEAARAALPDDVALMVDVNCPWSAEEAQRQVSALKDVGLGWIEEPVWPPDDAAALAQVRRAGVRISAGENASGVAGFRQYFGQRAIDIAQPSVTKIGGISGILDVIRLAAEHDVRVVPHCFYYGAGLLATAQIVATLPDDVALEVPWLQWPTRLYPQHDFGPTFDLTDAPGLGFQPDLDVLHRHADDTATVVSNS